MSCQESISCHERFDDSGGYILLYVSGIYNCCLMTDDWDLGETERDGSIVAVAIAAVSLL